MPADDVAAGAGGGVTVVDVYSNSSSAPNRASSTFLRRPSETASAMPPLTTVSRSSRPKLRPLRCLGASRSATEASRKDSAARSAVLRAAAIYAFPTGDIDQMLGEIGRGYLSPPR